MDRKKSPALPWVLVLVMGAFIGFDKLTATPQQHTALIAFPTQRIYLSPKQGEPIGQMVWIPKTGKKYHKKSTCSNMNEPAHVSLDTAISLGYGKCSKCW